MKFLTFVVLIVLSISKIHALNWDFGWAKTIIIVEPSFYNNFGRRIDTTRNYNVGPCQYQQNEGNISKSKIICKISYNNSNYLQNTVTIYITGGDKFQKNEGISGWLIYHSNSNSNFVADKHIGSTKVNQSIGTNVELLKPYSNNYFEFIMTNGKRRKLYYNKIVIGNDKF